MRMGRLITGYVTWWYCCFRSSNALNDPRLSRPQNSDDASRSESRSGFVFRNRPTRDKKEKKPIVADRRLQYLYRKSVNSVERTSGRAKDICTISSDPPRNSELPLWRPAFPSKKERVILSTRRRKQIGEPFLRNR
jgi:hypothetical protein